MHICITNLQVLSEEVGRISSKLVALAEHSYSAGTARNSLDPLLWQVVQINVDMLSDRGRSQASLSMQPQYL